MKFFRDLGYNKKIKENRLSPNGKRFLAIVPRPKPGV
jgi:hypothetical protein